MQEHSNTRIHIIFGTVLALETPLNSFESLCGPVLRAGGEKNGHVLVENGHTQMYKSKTKMLPLVKQPNRFLRCLCWNVVHSAKQLSPNVVLYIGVVLVMSVLVRKFRTSAHRSIQRIIKSVCNWRSMHRLACYVRMQRIWESDSMTYFQCKTNVSVTSECKARG